MATAIIVDKILMGNSNDFYIRGFQDNRAAANIYLNAAAASFTIKTASGTTVATGPLSYIPSSNGDYVGGLNAAQSAALIDKGIYYIILTATQGDVTGTWDEQAVAEKRET